jgi:hypothetical protein
VNKDDIKSTVVEVLFDLGLVDSDSINLISFSDSNRTTILLDSLVNPQPEQEQYISPAPIEEET